MIQGHDIIKTFSRWGNIFIIACIILEILLFPSPEVLAGCAMTYICWFLFMTFGLKKQIIERHFFAWLIFVSMSLYRILPLPATLLEGKPVNWHFQLSYETFFGETILYIISVLAFILAVYPSQKNGWLSQIWYKAGLFRQPTKSQIWIIGSIGLCARIFHIIHGGAEIGDVGGKFMAGFVFLQYAPLLLFFPNFYKNNYINKSFHLSKTALIYLAFLALLSLSGNSRMILIEPFATFSLLFFLSEVKTSSFHHFSIKPLYVILFLVASLIVIPFTSNVSKAMLAVRSVREEVSVKELFKETWEIATDEEKLKAIEKANMFDQESDDYEEGWTEEYLEHFALNRFCNIRITDITLYHANRIGYANPNMQSDLRDRIWAILPSPFLRFLGVYVDKENIFSRGDYLYALSNKSTIYSGLRVTSHLADGLATFDYIYIFIQFVLFWLQFKLVDSFCWRRKNEIRYVPLALFSAFDFLAMFGNANGCINEMGYIIRGYWQFVVISFLVLFIVSKFYQFNRTA